MIGDFVYLWVVTLHHLDAAVDIRSSLHMLLKQLHKYTALKYLIYRNSAMEPSDILLVLPLTFCRLVDCPLLLTRGKDTDFKNV